MRTFAKKYNTWVEIVKGLEKRFQKEAHQILIKENERRCTDYISSCSEEESNLDELDILDELEELNKLDDLDDLDVLDELYELDKLDDEGNIKKKVKKFRHWIKL